MENDNNSDITRYVENPEALIELCKTVVQELSGAVPLDKNDLVEKRAQLKEVSRSVDQLSKLSITVPDDLRDLKLSLLVELETWSQNKEKIKQISEGLKTLLKTIEPSEPLTTPKRRKKSKKRSSRKDPYTKIEILRPEIIDALRSLGGTGETYKVLEIIEGKLNGQFLPGDLEKGGNGAEIWKNNVRAAASAMRKKGILRRDSPYGTWELSEVKNG